MYSVLTNMYFITEDKKKELFFILIRVYFAFFSYEGKLSF